MEESIDIFVKEYYDKKGTRVTYKNRFWQYVAASLLETGLKLVAIRKIKDAPGVYHYVAHIRSENKYDDWVKNLLLLSLFITNMRIGGYHVWINILDSTMEQKAETCMYDIYVGINAAKATNPEE